MSTTKSNYRAACIQLCSNTDIARNLKICSDLLREATLFPGVRLVCLPENFAFMGEENEKLAQAAEIDRQWKHTLLPLVRQLQVTLIAGGHPQPAPDGKVYNVSSVIDPSGMIVVQYRKIHLFDIDIPNGVSYRESASVAPGDTPVLFSGELGNIGLTVCYDLRFPELYRHLSAAGAEILVVSAAFTLFTGKDHWQVLLRSRAIENQCYVLAAAQWGRHSDLRQSFGNSVIIDPWGKVIACCPDREGVVHAEIDFQDLHDVRRRLPCLEHRRL